MSEPTTAAAAAAGYAGWKLLAFSGAAAALATIVVLLMLPPRSAREWSVGIITTVLGSICGGAAMVQWLELNVWLDTMPGTMGLIGLCFACGLPSWAITRWVFTWIALRNGKAIDEVLRDAADAARSVTGITQR